MEAKWVREYSSTLSDGLYKAYLKGERKEWTSLANAKEAAKEAAREAAREAAEEGTKEAGGEDAMEDADGDGGHC